MGVFDVDGLEILLRLVFVGFVFVDYRIRFGFFGRIVLVFRGVWWEKRGRGRRFWEKFLLSL